MGVAQNPQGWTDVTPAADTRISYVDPAGDDGSATPYDWDDAAIGADPYNPVGPINAYQTIRAALVQLRDGMADWVLLKRGETWDDQTLNVESAGRWMIDGRSANEPILVSAYGTGPLPEVKTPDSEDGLILRDGVRYVAFISLRIYAWHRDPDNAAFTGLNNTRNGIWYLRQDGVNPTKVVDFVLFEDIDLEFFTNNFTFGDEPSDDPVVHLTNLQVRRCRVYNSYNTQGHSQGLYCSGVASLELFENVFANNGWYGSREDPNTGATGFSQNIYIDSGNPVKGTVWNETAENLNNFIVRGNISYEPSGAGMQLRCGGTMEDNLLTRCPTPTRLGSLSGNPGSPPPYDMDWPNGVTISCIRNVIDTMVDVNSSAAQVRKALWPRNTKSPTVINDNIVTSQPGVSDDFMRAEAADENQTNTTTIDEVSRNITVLMNNGDIRIQTQPVAILAEENNIYSNPRSTPSGTNRNISNVTLVDATRNTASYNASIGNVSDDADFVTRALANKKDNWDIAYTAPAANAWIRDGIREADVGPAAPTGLVVAVS